MSFDETAEYRGANYLKGGVLDIDPYRLMAVNEMFFRVPKGNRKLISMEASTMRFIRIAVPAGKVKIRSVRLIAYENPDVRLCFRCADGELNEIFEAAKSTFRQNAVDVLTDCPSRERAGWLCDSYFSGEAERALTGANKIETNFLYCLLHRKCKIVPRNVFPMCYPSDHRDGKFIPNWGMWLVLEVENYKNADGRADIVNGLTERAEEFAEYLRAFRNADGLLENLESWVFVEMSEANELTNGVNFPTNMLYAAMLESLSRLTKNGEYAKQATQTRAAVQTYGKFEKYFVDCAKTLGGKYVPCTEKISEVCQYYAFYFGFASKENNGELFRACVEKNDSKLLEANDFFGRYLRIGYLVHAGEYRRALSDIKAYFYKEAEKTGTLWEDKDGKTSMCHGFSSVLTSWIAKAAKAVDNTAEIYYTNVGR